MNSITRSLEEIDKMLSDFATMGLIGSIEKWEYLVKASKNKEIPLYELIDLAKIRCGLCELYLWDNCKSCPLFAILDDHPCWEVDPLAPVFEAKVRTFANFQKIAEATLDLLRSLK